MEKNYSATKREGVFRCVNYQVRVIEPYVTVRIFANGAVLFQAARSVEALHKTMELITPLLHRFRVPPTKPADVKKLIANFDCLPQTTVTKDTMDKSAQVIEKIKSTWK